MSVSSLRGSTLHQVIVSDSLFLNSSVILEVHLFTLRNKLSTVIGRKSQLILHLVGIFTKCIYDDHTNSTERFKVVP